MKTFKPLGDFLNNSKLIENILLAGLLGYAPPALCCSSRWLSGACCTSAKKSGGFSPPSPRKK
jgi:hypothetical protein